MRYEPLDDPLVRKLQQLAAAGSLLTGSERDLIRDALCEIARLRTLEHEPRSHATVPGRMTFSVLEKE